MMTIMGAIAEFERGLIRKRTEECIERAKKRGKKFGPPERLDSGQSCPRRYCASAMAIFGSPTTRSA
jgi:DNA invertase Pin-like site-specific DNA recombinase